MAFSQDAVRLYEQDLLQKAEVLAIGLEGLRAADAARAAQLLAAISDRLETAVSGAPAGTRRLETAGSGERAKPLLVAARGGGEDNIEDFILDILAESPLGLSVQDIVDHLDEAQLEVKRQTLVVRLHRMVRAGKLASRAHGHYALSEAEHSRRRA
jgi:Glu-tRNA(Gln) amidotransferase subunit E-like FAD-binding protein